MSRNDGQNWMCLKNKKPNKTSPDTGLLHKNITDSTVQIKFTVFLMTLGHTNCLSFKTKCMVHSHDNK